MDLPPIVLIASRAHRQGPDGRLIRFVREFEELLYKLEIRATLGAWWSLHRAGLLSGHAKFAPLEAGRQGGLVHVTHAVVKDDVGAVIYFLDPRDPTSMYPETTALKRECVAHKKFFLSTYASAVEWAALTWRKTSSADNPYLLQPHVPTLAGAKPLAEQRIALIAHDARKVDMLEFALLKHFDFLDSFHTRVGTGTTGGYLNGSVHLDELRRQVREELENVSSVELQEQTQKKLDIIDAVERSGRRLPVIRMASGPKGGDVQIAHAVIQKPTQCDKVIFFEDPYTAQPHEADIQLLERTCRLRGEEVVCLSDSTSADIWARAWQVNDGSYLKEPPITLLRALERGLSTPGNRVRVVLAPTAPGNVETMGEVCHKAAWYLASCIERFSDDPRVQNEPVRVAVPWGNTMKNMLVDLRKVLEKIQSELDASGGRLRAPKEPRALTAVPMIGSILSEDPTIEANALAAMLAALYHNGTSDNIPTGAFVLREKHDPALLGKVNEEFGKCDVVVLTGAPPREQGRTAMGMTAKAPIWLSIRDRAIARRAVGEVCGAWFMATGESIDPGPYERVGFEWDELRRIAADEERRVILVIGGDEAYLGVARALIRARVVTTLITDMEFGRKLLELVIESGPRS